MTTTTMMHLQFGQPQWLWAGAFCCAGLAILFVRAARLRRRAAARLAGARFVSTASRGRRLAKQALLLLGVAATFVALARPLAGFRFEEERRPGIDLMFAVDTSKSMLATDLRPDRLTRAKLAVSDLLRDFPGERAGLIAFAGDAFVQAPMTVDHDVFREALDALDTNVIARGGTDIAAPIRAAAEAMASEPDRRKILVILSDGEDLQGQALAAARQAAGAGLVIYTVGVGTPAGDLIPIVQPDGQRALLRDADGQVVRSRLDETTLRQLAEITGGAYATLGPSGQGLETLYRTHLANLPQRTVAERIHKIYTERFQYPLAVAIGCLLLDLSLGERRRAIGRGRSGRARGTAAVAAAALLVVMMRGAGPASAASATEPASVTGDGNSVSLYNDATAAYRKNDFSKAQRRFQDATHTTDLGVQANAYYDLGNARYRVGQASLAKDRPATIETWKSALTAYDGALALQPKDADAHFNRDLVARRLAALEEQQRQDQQQQNQQQKNQQQKNQQNRDQKKSDQKKPDQKDQQSAQNQRGQKNQPSAQNQPGQPSPGGGPQQGQQPRPALKPGDQKNADRAASAGADKPQPASSASPQNADQRGAQPMPSPPSGKAPTPQAAEAESPPPQGPGVVSAPNVARDERGERGENDRAGAAPRQAGALSPKQAEQLLDSVSGELRRLPIASARRQPQNPDDDRSFKDW